MRRKGELSPAAIDRTYPHQIAVPSLVVSGSFAALQAWLPERSAAPRRRSVVGPDDEWWTIFAFKAADDAADFKAQFGGIDYDPQGRDRTVWQRWSKRF